jgi:hypothetical protein
MIIVRSAPGGGSSTVLVSHTCTLVTVISDIAALLFGNLSLTLVIAHELIPQQEPCFRGLQSSRIGRKAPHMFLFMVDVISS